MAENPLHRSRTSRLGGASRDAAQPAWQRRLSQAVHRVPVAIAAPPKHAGTPQGRRRQAWTPFTAQRQAAGKINSHTPQRWSTEPHNQGAKIRPLLEITDTTKNPGHYLHVPCKSFGTFPPPFTQAARCFRAIRLIASNGAPPLARAVRSMSAPSRYRPT